MEESLGGQMVGTGSLDGGLIDGDHSAVGVGSQTVVGSRGNGSKLGVGGSNGGGGNGSGVQSSGTVGESSSTIGGSGSNERSSSVSGSSSDGGGSGDDGGSSSIDGSLSSKVLSTGGNHSGLISRSHSSVSVGNQGGDMDGTSISGGNGGKGSRGVCGTSSDDGAGSSIGSSLGSQMLSTGSSHSGLINGSDSAIGISDKTVAGAGIGEHRPVGTGDTDSKNLNIINIIKSNAESG